jgi:hypothetical protein
MAAAIIEVALTVRVHAVLSAEDATAEELAAFVTRDPEGPKGAVLGLLERRGEQEAGWLDDDRPVFALGVTFADVQGGDVLEVVK